MTPISASTSIGGVNPAALTTPAKTAGSSAAGNSFGDLVKNFVGQTNQDQLSADAAIKDLATGQTDDVHQVVMAVANAEMSFQLFMEIRNQLIESYNELMRMQF